MKTFKVKILKKCIVCGKDNPKRFRSYCSKKCRDKNTNRRWAKRHTEWQRMKRDKKASIPDDKKIRCLFCGKYYRQVGSHVVQVHGVTCREYREYFDLERKRGIVPPDYRKLKGDQALENGTFKNLKVGRKFWFKENDPRAGRYKRSHITLERLKNLNKLRKKICK